MKRPRYLRVISLILVLVTLLPLVAACKDEEGYIFKFMVGETLYHESEFESLANAALPEEPTEEGKTFIGWYFDKDVWKEPLILEALTDATQEKGTVYTVYALFITTSSGGGEPMKYFTVSKSEPTVNVYLDFASQALLDANPTLSVTEKDGKKTYRWVANGGATFKLPAEADFSQSTTLCFSIYSEANTGKTYQIRFNCPDDMKGGNAMAPYYRYSIKVDFVGWKTFEIDPNTCNGNYGPTWRRIDSISLDASGWGLTPDASTVLCIGNVTGESFTYILNAPDGMDTNDPVHYTSLIRRNKELLVGTAEGSTKAEYAQRVQGLASKCKSAWDSFKSTYGGGAENSLFGLVITHGNKGDESKIQTLYGKLYDMAAGYATAGGEFYHNEDLLADIKKGLEYGYKYYYGPTVWEKGTYGNWWQWDIGIPLSLTSILTVLSEELGPELCKKYLEAFDYLNPLPTMTACNKIWIAKCVILSAALQKDGLRIVRSAQECEDVFDYVTSGDGFYTDGSFIQHDKLAYTGGYGISMLNELTNVMYFLYGSPFEWHTENVANQYKWVFENFRPCMYGGNFMAAMRGREVYRNTSEAGAGNTVVAALIRMQEYAPAELKAQLEGLILYYMRAANKSYSTSVAMCQVDYCVDLFNSTDKEPLGGYYLTKTLPSMDRVVQHLPDYGFCLSLSSTRIYKYESINEENKTGWYQGDGMVYIYTDGYDYKYDFFHYADPYLMPGTTVNSATRIEVCPTPHLFNRFPFAGGVENGKYGAAGFRLGYDIGTVGTTAQNSTFNSNIDASINAKKSYFMFDNEIVCIGSDISDQSGTAVKTVVENRLWRSGDVLSINGSAITPNATLTQVNAATMHFTNMGGYYFYPGKNGLIKCAKADGERDFLQITVDHGARTGVSNGFYAYAYLPEASVSETEAYNASPDTVIVAQTPYVHAVAETKLGALGAIFYDDISFSNTSGATPVTAIEADGECAVMIVTENGQTKISVSDPTQLRESMTLTLTTALSTVVSADSGVSVAVNAGGTVTVSIASKGSVGATYTVVLQ